MKLNEMKLVNRLQLAIGTILFLMVFMSLISFNQMKIMNDVNNKIITENNEKIYLNSNMLDSVHIVARVSRTLFLLNAENEKNNELNKIEDARKNYEFNWSALQKHVPSEEGAANRQRIENAKRNSQSATDEMLELLSKGKKAEASAVLIKEVMPTTQIWIDELHKNIELQKKSNEKDIEESQEAYRNGRVELIVSLGLSIVLSAIVSWYISRSIINQLGAEPFEVANVAMQVANGELGYPIKLKTGDGSSVMYAMNQMRLNLLKIVINVREGSESVATAAIQIAQGNADLSNRTEHQASALEETAASMEELGSTVNLNAENSRQANLLVKNATQLVDSSRKDLNKLSLTMKEIELSSQRIESIIGLVDGLAFQTNLLALNASVEAARAGEQGRGFSVVATEVRSLAAKSTEAAKEIKELVKSSIDRVDSGAKLTSQVRGSMEDVVQAVSQAADMVANIAAASVEQSSGVGQVGEAVTQIDHVTQQNAALVEEMSAATQSLSSQANELVKSVSIFKLA